MDLWRNDKEILNYSHLLLVPCSQRLAVWETCRLFGRYHEMKKNWNEWWKCMYGAYKHPHKIMLVHSARCTQGIPVGSNKLKLPKTFIPVQYTTDWSSPWCTRGKHSRGRERHAWGLAGPFIQSVHVQSNIYQAVQSEQTSKQAELSSVPVSYTHLRAHETA